MTADGPMLTEGQIEVLRLYADGHTYRSAGAVLHISESTAKRRAGEAADVLDTNHIAHTIAVALRLGLLDEEPSMPAEDEYPRLINIANGTEYEWVNDPPSGSGPGYANVDDHDWTWPRDELERAEPVEEIRSLDPFELARLRGLE